MSPRLPHTTIAVSVSLLFFATNVAFAYKPEVSVWEQRQQARAAAGTADKRLAFALPPAAPISALSNPVGPAVQGRNADKAGDDPAGKMDATLTALAAFGRVRAPGGARAASASGRTVVHIQDVHRHEEAQRNIASAIQALANQQAVGVLALEGGFSDIDLAPFQAFPDKVAARTAADYLLRRHQITGPIYAAIVTPGMKRVVGIDDRRHHSLNVDAYLRSLPLKKASKAALVERRLELSRKKESAFHPELREFDSLCVSHRTGELSLGDYAREVYERVPPSRDGRLFLEAYALESALDFSRVERERTRLLSRLASSLSSSSLNRLVEASFAYRAGKMRHADFYDHLVRLCESHGVTMSEFPAMRDYVRYVSLSERIDAENLLRSLSAAEATAYSGLARSDEQKEIIALDRQTFLAEKLLEQELTNHEWDELSQTLSMPDQVALAPFLDFYREAKIRDEKMANGVIAALESAPADRLAILVTGGFHSDGIDQRLAQAGHEVISFSPRITRIDLDGGAAYLSIFAQERTPLEKLFAGERLFLAEPVLPPAGLLQTTAAMAVQMMAPAERGTESQVDEKARLWAEATLKQLGFEPQDVNAFRRDGRIVLSYRLGSSGASVSHEVPASGLTEGELETRVRSSVQAEVRSLFSGSLTPKVLLLTALPALLGAAGGWETAGIILGIWAVALILMLLRGGSTPNAKGSEGGVSRRSFLALIGLNATIASLAVLVRPGPMENAPKKEDDFSAPGDPRTSLAERLLNSVESLLRYVGLRSDDFHTPTGQEPRHSLSRILGFFKNPRGFVRTASNFGKRVEDANDLSGMMPVIDGILDMKSSGANRSAGRKVRLPQDVPSALREVLETALSALDVSQTLLNEAVDSVSPEERLELLRLNDWPDPKTGVKQQLIWGNRYVKGFSGMDKFRQDKLMEAGRLAFEAVDAITRAVRESNIRVSAPISIDSPIGKILIAASGDDVFTEERLAGVAVLIKTGGTSRYVAPAAAAGERQIRIVIDNSSSVDVDGRGHFHGNAGAGIFGIGIMALTNRDGRKSLDTGPYSQGAGLGGIGALMIEGKATLKADRYVQGAGLFGAGVLLMKNATGSTISAVQSGMGIGLTRGAGLFSVQGDDVSIEAGLVLPDPREGSTSLCLGVGFGPRAYAGGGVGIAALRGNRNRIMTSHMAVGTGYWHAAGVFRMNGNDNRVQGARYIGSGVHYGFGHIEMLGDRNSISSRMVMAYAWDNSISSFLFRGDGGMVRVEDWGALTASQRRSFTLFQIEGDGLTLRIPWAGNAAPTGLNREASYVLGSLKVTNSRIAYWGPVDRVDDSTVILPNPDGVFYLDGKGNKFLLDLKLAPLETPKPRTADYTKKEMVDLKARLDQAQRKLRSGEEKLVSEAISEFVDIASAFSLDKETPRQALRILMGLTDSQVAELISLVNDETYLQNFHLFVAVPGYGALFANDVIARFNRFSPRKQELLLGWLRTASPSVALPFLLKVISNPGATQLHPAAMQAISQIYNQILDEDAGFRLSLQRLGAYLADPKNVALEKAATDAIAALRFGDAFGFMATAAPVTGADRQKVLDAATGVDLSGSVGEATAKAILQVLMANPAETAARVRSELVATDRLEAELRSSLRASMARPVPVADRGPQAERLRYAIAALGRIAHAGDAGLFSRFLDHPDDRIRRAAVFALTDMGEAGFPFLEEALRSGSVTARRLVIVAITRSPLLKSRDLLKQAYSDPDPSIRLAALSVIDSRLPPVLAPLLAEIRLEAVQILDRDPDADIQQSLENYRTAIRRSKPNAILFYIALAMGMPRPSAERWGRVSLVVETASLAGTALFLSSSVGKGLLQAALGFEPSSALVLSVLLILFSFAHAAMRNMLARQGRGEPVSLLGATIFHFGWFSPYILAVIVLSLASPAAWVVGIPLLVGAIGLHVFHDFREFRRERPESRDPRTAAIEANLSGMPLRLNVSALGGREAAVVPELQLKGRAALLADRSALEWLTADALRFLMSGRGERGAVLIYAQDQQVADELRRRAGPEANFDIRVESDIFQGPSPSGGQVIDMDRFVSRYAEHLGMPGAGADVLRDLFFVASPTAVLEAKDADLRRILENLIGNGNLFVVSLDTLIGAARIASQNA